MKIFPDKMTIFIFGTKKQHASDNTTTAIYVAESKTLAMQTTAPIFEYTSFNINSSDNFNFAQQLCQAISTILELYPDAEVEYDDTLHYDSYTSTWYEEQDTLPTTPETPHNT